MKNDRLYVGNFSRLMKLIRTEKRREAMLSLMMLFSFVSILAQPGTKAFNNLNAEAFRKSALDERVLLITDRELYLCGENIVFEAFIYDGNWFLPLIISTVLYVELYNQDNLVVSKGKFFMRNGRGSGTISIPRDVKSNIYYIRAYTNYMKNFGVQQFFTKKLKIVNPFNNSADVELLPRSGNSKNIEEDSVDSKLVVPLERFEIDLKTDKKEYGNRKNIEVMISTRNNNGLPVKTNLVLFTCLSDTGFKADKILPDLAQLSTHELIQKSSGEGTLKYLPEMKGDIISGRLVYKDDLPTKGIEVLQSFTGNISWIESSITDDNGNFYFRTDEQNNKGDLILKVQNTSRETSIILDDEFFSNFPPPVMETLRLAEDEIELISKQFINIQVDDAFSVEKKDKIPKIGREKYAFYGKEYVDYKFPDYLKLPNMKEFIFEVIQGVILSKVNKKDVIDILEETTMKKIGPHPLIIIDGIPVTESSVIIGLPSEKVEYIRVVRNKYFYKDQIFDGILDIITYPNDGSSFDLPEGTFRYNFTHPTEENFLIEPKITSNDAGRIPLYKNLLYWNSNVTTDDDGIARLSFYTPDNTGTFSIQCFGLTPEGLAGEGGVFILVPKLTLQVSTPECCQSDK